MLQSVPVTCSAVKVAGGDKYAVHHSEDGADGNAMVNIWNVRKHSCRPPTGRVMPSTYSDTRFLRRGNFVFSEATLSDPATFDLLITSLDAALVLFELWGCTP